jgi:hypothetical protein
MKKHSGKNYEVLIGTRAQVWHGTAYKTSGGLTKNDLIMNKHGRIVSKAKHVTAKREKRLLKFGYGTKKGKFGFVKLGKSKKMTGGNPSTFEKRPQGGGNASTSTFEKRPQGGGNASTSTFEKRPQGGGKMYGSVYSPALVSESTKINLNGNSNYNSTNVQMEAGMSGGSGLSGLNPASISGLNNSHQPSIDVQMQAGMSGGRRRRRKTRRHRK